jgi:hypothetical protein
MILSGMGPVDTLRSTAGKLFATAYALFSGVLFLVLAGIETPARGSHVGSSKLGRHWEPAAITSSAAGAGRRRAR